MNEVRMRGSNGRRLMARFLVDFHRTWADDVDLCPADRSGCMDVPGVVNWWANQVVAELVEACPRSRPVLKGIRVGGELDFVFSMEVTLPVDPPTCEEAAEYLQEHAYGDMSGSYQVVERASDAEEEARIKSEIIEVLRSGVMKLTYDGANRSNWHPDGLMHIMWEWNGKSVTVGCDWEVDAIAPDSEWRHVPGSFSAEDRFMLVGEPGYVTSAGQPKMEHLRAIVDAWNKLIAEAKNAG